MNAFQQCLLTVIATHPGINRAEIALALGLDTISCNNGRYLRFLEDTGRIVSKRVCIDGRKWSKVYRTSLE